MVEVYHYVKFACPLMDAAIERLPHTDTAIRDYLRRHVSEEKGHELWMLSDLARLGFDSDKIQRSLPMAETITLVSCQEYILKHLNPISFFGYIYALESSTSSRDDIRKRAAEMGIPIEAMSTFLEHAELDTNDHILALREVLNDNVLDSGDQSMILWNYSNTMRQLTDLVLAVERRDDIVLSLSSLKQLGQAA